MTHFFARAGRWLRRRWGRLALLALLALLMFLATSQNPAIWPVRNTLYYEINDLWAGPPAAPARSGDSELRGCVTGGGGRPVSGAIAMVSEPYGLVHRARAGGDGCYRLRNLPAGRFVPMISAPGYEAAAIEPWGLSISLGPGETQVRDARLEPIDLPPLTPAAAIALSDPVTLSVELPRPSTAVRRQLSFDNGGDPNQLTYVYQPAGSHAPRPVLLAVYPGTAAEWEGVSIPLAAAGYVVVAIGPEYSLDLDADIDELRRLVGLVRGGVVPGADGGDIALIAGSYSSLHVQRLLLYDTGFRSAVLLGPLSDLFDFRLRYESGTFMPPFGLDQALIALGWPNLSTERYHRYSSQYHVRPDWPPILLMHSKTDDVVPYEQSEQLIVEFDRQGVYHEDHFLEGMSHYLRTDGDPAELSRLYAITLDFLIRSFD